MKTIKLLFALAIIFSTASCSSELFVNSGKKWNLSEASKKINDNTVFYLDYQRLASRNEIASLNHLDIASVSVYTEPDKDVPAAIKGDLKNGAVSWITKKYAISQYRPKLAALSNEYRELTANLSADRDELLYVVKDSVLKPNVEGKLMDLKFSKIKSIKILTTREAQAIYGSSVQNSAVIIN